MLGLLPSMLQYLLTYLSIYYIKLSQSTQELVQLVQQMGTKWVNLAKMLPGRTDNAIKNRWNSRMRRILRQQRKDEQQRKNELTRRGTGLAAQVAPCESAANTARAVAEIMKAAAKAVADEDGGGEKLAVHLHDVSMR